MKNGWKEERFEKCIEPVEYTRKIQRKDFLDNGKFPIVSQEAEFINGYWNDKDDLFKVSTPVVVFGDHTQILKYVDFDFVLGADGVKILLPQKFLLPKYFYFQLQAATIKSLGYARHFKLLKELFIPRFLNNNGLSGFSTKRLRVLLPPKPMPKRISKTPAASLKATFKKSLQKEELDGWRNHYRNYAKSNMVLLLKVSFFQMKVITFCSHPAIFMSLVVTVIEEKNRNITLEKYHSDSS